MLLIIWFLLGFLLCFLKKMMLFSVSSSLSSFSFSVSSGLSSSGTLMSGLHPWRSSLHNQHPLLSPTPMSQFRPLCCDKSPEYLSVHYAKGAPCLARKPVSLLLLHLLSSQTYRISSHKQHLQLDWLLSTLKFKTSRCLPLISPVKWDTLFPVKRISDHNQQVEVVLLLVGELFSSALESNYVSGWPWSNLFRVPEIKQTFVRMGSGKSGPIP